MVVSKVVPKDWHWAVMMVEKLVGLLVRMKAGYLAEKMVEWRVDK